MISTTLYIENLLVSLSQSAQSDIFDDKRQYKYFEMGNSSQTPSPKRYTELRIQQNELLSSLMVVQDPQSRTRLMAKQLNIASEHQYTRILRELKVRKSLSSKRMGQYLIQIREIQTKQTNEICGKSYRITIYLQYLDGTLKTQFSQRQRERKCFNEQQVWNILRTVVGCLIVLHDNSYKNLHIYKQSIFRTENGAYKLADTQLSNRIHPYFQLLNNVPTKKGTYLAPELLNELRSNCTDLFQTPKADIFTLAIVALQLLTLNPYDNFYDYEHMHVDLAGLRSCVEQVQCSGELKSILEMMLVQEEQERIGLLSLKQLLSGSESRSEHSTFKSYSTTQPRKTATRTFISRSKPESRASKTSSVQKISTESHMKKEASHSTQRQRKIEAQQAQPPQINYISNHIIYQPIESVQVPLQQQKAPQIQQIQIQTQPQSQTVPLIEVRQTPRSSFDYQNGLFSNRLNMKQFQTPVNMLYQPSHQQQPQSTPIRKVQVLNSFQQDSSHPQQQPLSNPTAFQQYFTSKPYGTHQFSNGAKYEGEFNQKNQFDGNGMLYYPSGKLCYSGSWKSNSFHGFGVLYNEIPSNDGNPTNYHNFNFVDKNNWQYYQGQFDNDRKQGFGTIYFINGDKFSGCFKDDAVQGFGTFFLAIDGRNINGIWAQNVLKR